MRIFMGHLAFTTTEVELARLFHPYGLVERLRIPTFLHTSRTRGFGFGEMPEATAAQAAMTALQGVILAGRT